MTVDISYLAKPNQIFGSRDEHYNTSGIPQQLFDARWGSPMSGQVGGTSLLELLRAMLASSPAYAPHPYVPWGTTRPGQAPFGLPRRHQGVAL